MENLKEKLKISLCSSVASDQEKSIDLICSYINQNHQHDELLVQLMCQIFDTNANDLCTQSSILKLVIKIPTLSFQAIDICLDRINRGFIKYREAVYCLSEVASFLEQYFHKTLKGIVTHEFEVILKEMADRCLYSVYRDSAANDLEHGHTLFTLVPSLMKLLAYDSRCKKTSLLDMLETLLSVEWHKENVCAISNLVCDIWGLMTPRHISKFKTKASEVVPKVGQDDLPGLVLVGRRLYEMSQDREWFEYLRMCYRCINVANSQQAESLLEHSLSQSPNTVYDFISYLEMCATNQLDTLIRQSYVEKSILDRHSEYDGVALLTLTDLRLLLMLSRCCISFRKGELAFPNIIGSNSQESQITYIENFESLICSRAVLVLLMVLPIISALDRAIDSDESGSLTSSELLRTVQKEWTQLCDRGVVIGLLECIGVVSGANNGGDTSTAANISSSTSSTALTETNSWLQSARITDLLSSLLYILVHSDVSNDAFSCIAAIVSKCGVQIPANNIDLVENSITKVSQIITMTICSLFQTVHFCRQALLSVVLSGVAFLGSTSSTTVIVTSFTHAAKKSLPKILARQSESRNVIEYSHTVTVNLLAMMCDKFPCILVPTYTHEIQVFLETAMLLPTERLPNIFQSIHKLCKYSIPLTTSISQFYRKGLHNPDIAIKLFCVYHLVQLIPHVMAESVQLELIMTLSYIITMPLFRVRRCLYTSITEVFLKMPSQSAEKPLVHVNNVRAFLSKLLTHVGIYIHKCKYNYQGQSDADTNALVDCDDVFVPSKCFDIISRFADKERASGQIVASQLIECNTSDTYLNHVEDIEQLIVLVFILERYTCKNDIEDSDTSQLPSTLFNHICDTIFEEIQRHTALGPEYIRLPKNRVATSSGRGLQSYSMTSWIIQAVLRRVFTGVVTDEEDLMHANGSPTSNTRVMHFAIVQTCRKALDGIQAILAAIYTNISSLLASPSEASSLMKDCRILDAITAVMLVNHDLNYLEGKISDDMDPMKYSPEPSDTSIADNNAVPSQRFQSALPMFLSASLIEDLLGHASHSFRESFSKWSHIAERTEKATEVASTAIPESIGVHVCIVNSLCRLVQEIHNFPNRQGQGLQVSQRLIVPLFKLFDSIGSISVEQSIQKRVVEYIVTNGIKVERVIANKKRPVNSRRHRSSIKRYTDMSDMSDMSEDDLEEETETFSAETVEISKSNPSSSISQSDVIAASLEKGIDKSCQCYENSRLIFREVIRSSRVHISPALKPWLFDLMDLDSSDALHENETQVRENKYESDSRAWLRGLMFTVRYQLVSGLHTCLSSIVNSRRSEKCYAGESVESTQQMTIYFAQQLEYSLKEGIIVRNLKVYLSLLELLRNMDLSHIISVRADTPLTTKETSTCHSAAQHLLNCFLYLDRSTPQQIVKLVMRLSISFMQYFHASQLTMACISRAWKIELPFQTMSSISIVSNATADIFQLSDVPDKVDDNPLYLCLSKCPNLIELIFSEVIDSISIRLNLVGGKRIQSSGKVIDWTDCFYIARWFSLVLDHSKSDKSDAKACNIVISKFIQKTQPKILALMLKLVSAASAECSRLLHFYRRKFARLRSHVKGRNRLLKLKYDGDVWSGEDEEDEEEESNDGGRGGVADDEEGDDGSDDFNDRPSSWGSVIRGKSGMYKGAPWTSRKDEDSISGPAAKQEFQECTESDSKYLSLAALASLLGISKDCASFLNCVSSFSNASSSSHVPGVNVKFFIGKIEEVVMKLNHLDAYCDNNANMLEKVLLSLPRDKKRLHEQISGGIKVFVKEYEKMGSVGRSKSKCDSRDSGDESEEEAQHTPVLSEIDGFRKRRRKSARARSRNNVIDKWLGDEEGDDTYADLEDFLVD